jgi:hypothetical protein
MASMAGGMPSPRFNTGVPGRAGATDLQQFDILDRPVLHLVVRDQRIHARRVRQRPPPFERHGVRRSVGRVVDGPQAAVQAYHLLQAAVGGVKMVDTPPAA